MFSNIDYEKLAAVLNKTSEQGKSGFVQMLWNNQPQEVRSQLTPLLSSATLEILDQLE
mgnify:FL=1